MNKNLHIICLNVPYPADFGGVFDLFYKLPVLQKLGVKIHLHCFEYGRGEQPELNKYCEHVYYYKRKTGIRAFSFKLPYIVSSRADNDLLNRLLEDDSPILMEGVHCTYLLNDGRFNGRKLFVRLHNVEHIYYRHLYKTTSSIFRKFYSLRESQELYKYEKRIVDKAVFLAVSSKDVEDYNEMGCKRVEFLPLFLPNWKVNGSEGKGSYCLYHGNLEISENEQAVIWLIGKVYNNLDFALVIAGKNPPTRLTKLTSGRENICLVANPNEQEMQDIISKAHIHILPSLNATGIKLKLINALYNGRHIIGNNATAEGTGLEKLCHLADDVQTLKELIKHLYAQPFTKEESAKRKTVLDNMFDNEANAQKLVNTIWSEPMQEP
jgi:hypothetical protein